MPGESALVVLVPEAEALVASFRSLYDPSAAAGVPAHVTVLYPFKPPHDLTADVVRGLRELFSKVPAFRTSFVEVGRFPDTLYLSPEPAESFRHLTEAAAKRFPEAPPYGGQFAEVVPHLTVALASDPRRLEEIAAAFDRAAKDHLPIQAQVKEIVLMDNETGRWLVRGRFPLGTAEEAH